MGLGLLKNRDITDESSWNGMISAPFEANLWSTFPAVSLVAATRSALCCLEQSRATVRHCAWTPQSKHLRTNQGRQRALSSHDVTKTLVQFESGVSGCVDCGTPECGAILELAHKRAVGTWGPVLPSTRPCRRAHSDVLDSATVPSDSSLIGQAIVHWGLKEQILTMETGKPCFLTLWITTFSVKETRSQVYLEPLEPGLLRTS
jgi:hypothetical protein